MRTPLLNIGICVGMWSFFSVSAAVVDRIAAVVGKNVITESEVLEEVRVTEFLNDQPLDLGPDARRAAAERLVDQQLIRNEMQIGAYPQPPASEGDALLRRYRQENYASAEQFRSALEKYGITEQQLKQHLVWQQAAIQFTDVRFRPHLEAEADRARADRAQADRVQTADRSGAGGAEPAANGVDQQMEAWLKQARTNTKVQFKKEAFQ